jgi:hypothetical protein
MLAGNISALNNLKPEPVQIFLFMLRASLCIKPSNSLQTIVRWLSYVIRGYSSALFFFCKI